MTFQHLKKEIDQRCEVVQAYFNYKNGDLTHDAFVMFAIETRGESKREFYETTITGQSNQQVVNRILHYEDIFNSLDFNIGDPTEADHMYIYGSRYLNSKRGTLPFG